MDRILVRGGRRLAGTIRVSGAKNSLLPCMAASIMCGGRVRLANAPLLRDVETMAQLLRILGAEVNAAGGEVDLDCSRLCAVAAPYDLVKTMRASVLVLGPLIGRFGKARVSLPGGCAIGARPIDIHIDGLKRMGVGVEMEQGYVVAAASGLHGARIRLGFPTVTGTENIIMAAVLAKGETLIENAAMEPEVKDLADMLCVMGAKIEGAGTDTITINGVDALGGGRHTVIADRIEAGTFMTAAAITGGDVLLKGAVASHSASLIHHLRRAGASISEVDGGIRAAGGSRISPVDVKTLPHPGFPTDMQAQFMALMAVADGTSIIEETVFENRFMHVAELRRMGASIELAGRNATVRGVAGLQGANVMATDLRASACLLLAALRAEGVTEVGRVYHIDRGYERIEEKLRALSADIERINPPA